MKNFFDKWQLSKYQLYGLSFGLPIVLMLIYLMLRHITPFGSHTLLMYDLNDQYVNFFIYLRNAVLHLNNTSFTYDFTQGFGNSMIGTWAYYLFSPYNLLLVLFDPNHMNLGINLILLLKYATAGLTMSYFLNKKFTDLNRFWILTLSLVYALNGWGIAFYINLMWLDGMIFLPLIIVGLEKLVDKHQSRMYLWLLALMIVINYYMAYIVIMFTFTYLLYYLVLKNIKLEKMFDVFFYWVRITFLSLLLASIMFVPTLFSVFSSKFQYGDIKTASFGTFQTLYQLPSRFMVGTFKMGDFEYPYPEIFVGSLVLILVLEFFLNAKIAKKVRIAASLVIAFFMVSLISPAWNVLLHAMRTPNWYTYRWVFAIVFFMIYLAAFTLSKMDNLSIKRQSIKFGIIGLGFVTTLVMIQHIPNVNLFKISFAIISVLVMSYLLHYRKTSWGRITILGVTMIELFVNLLLVLNASPHVLLSHYQNGVTQLENAGKIAKQHGGENYRNQLLASRTMNDGLLSGLMQGVINNSITSVNNSQIGAHLGQNFDYAIDDYQAGTLLSDSLLGFKNFVQFNQDISSDGLLKFVNKNINYYDVKFKNADYTIYQNPQTLGLGFVGSDKATKPIATYEPIDFQSQLINQITNKDNQLFKPVPFVKAYQTKHYVILKVKNKSVDPHYLVSTISFSKFSKVTINTHPFNRRMELLNSKNVVMGLPENVNHITTVKLKLLKPNTKIDLNKLSYWRLDYPRYKSVMKNLQQHQFHVESVKDGEIVGNVNVNKSNQMLLTTIPSEPGWHVYVNGKPHQFTTWQQYIGFKLKPGQYHIKMVYHDFSLKWGTIITVITLIGILIKDGWVYVSKRKSKTK